MLKRPVSQLRVCCDVRIHRASRMHPVRVFQNSWLPGRKKPPLVLRTHPLVLRTQVPVLCTSSTLHRGEAPNPRAGPCRLVLGLLNDDHASQ